jgi:hypothetical protein
MNLFDKALNARVSVRDRECPGRPCYRPRPDPGPYAQGRGYREGLPGSGWLCGVREARGCPS